MIVDFFVATFLKLFGAIIEVVTQLFVSNLASEEIFGYVNFYFALATLLYFLLFGGRVKTIIKNVSVGKSIANFNKLYIKRYLIPVVLVFVVYLVVNPSIEMVYVLLITLALAWFFEYNSYLFAVDNRILATAENYLFLRAFILISVIVMYFFTSFSAQYILLAYVIAHILVLLVQLIYKKKKPETTVMVDDESLTKQYTFYQSISFLQNTFTNIPKVLSFILGGAISTALFSVGLIIKQLLYFISGPTSKIFFSSFAKHHENGDAKELKYNYQDATRWQVFFTFPLIILILFKYEEILSFFGQGYQEAGIIVVLISITTALEIGIGPTSNVLQMIGYEKREMYNYIIALATMIVISLAMQFTGYSEYALITGYVASTVVINILRYATLAKRTHITPYKPRDFIYILVMNTLLIVALFFQIKIFDHILLSAFIAGVFILLQFALSVNKYDREEIGKVIHTVTSKIKK